MIAAYDKMNPITDDIMETLSAMSKHDEEYMQKFSAVSGLLFADVKPNTKEYYAKKLLRKHSLQILGDKRDRKPEKFQYYAELNETYQKVSFLNKLDIQKLRLTKSLHLITLIF